MIWLGSQGWSHKQQNISYGDTGDWATHANYIVMLPQTCSHGSQVGVGEGREETREGVEGRGEREKRVRKRD